MLILRVLGPLVAEADGRDIRLGGAKQRAVLALLIGARGRTVSADRLIDAVWDDDLPADPANTLRHYIARLRTALTPGVGSDRGQLVRRDGNGYSLDTSGDGVSVDADLVEKLSAEAEAMMSRGSVDDAVTLYDRALSLSRGEPFGELADLDDLRPEIERLAELLASVREASFEARMAAGTDPNLISDLAAATLETPLRERLWAQLMVALYRAGRQAEALRAYQAARDHLADELGIEPGPELTDLEGRVLRHDPELRGPDRLSGRSARSGGAPASVPSPPTSFIGREDVIEAIVDQLAEAKLVTLLGPGGVGKTRVGLEVARRLAGSHRDGVVGVWLDSVDDPALVAGVVARELGVAEDPDLDVVETIERQMCRSHLLLLLDGCEPVVSVCAGLVARLVTACPGVSILVTSQHALRVAGERLVEIPLMEAEREGTDLFIERARDVRPGFDPTDEERDVIADIVQRVDGIPLAIELAAARVRILGLAQIRDAVGDGQALAARTAGSPPRQHSVPSAVGWSLSLLGPDERDLMERLAVFVGAFDADAVLRVVEGSTIERLADLIDKSLVRGSPEPGGSMVYRILGSIHRQVLGTARSTEWWEDMTLRHARYYSELADEAGDGLRSPAAKRCLRTIEQAEDNILAAMGRVIELNAFDVAEALFCHVARYFDWKGRVALPNMWMGRIESMAGDRPLSSRYLVWAGVFAWELGEFERASALLERSIEQAEVERNPVSNVTGLGSLGLVRLSTSDLESADDLSRRAFDLSKTVPDPWFEAWGATTLARVAAARGRMDEVDRLGRLALPVFARLGDRNGEAWALLTLSAGAGDDHERAVRLAADALVTADSVNATRSMSWALEELAVLAHSVGDSHRAVILLGAMGALQVRRGTPVPPSKRASHDAVVTDLRLALGGSTFDHLLARGAGMEVDEIVAGCSR